MKEFFSDDVLLYSESAKEIYGEVKDLPIIDYHCHLDQNKIEEDAKFSDIGQLWLAGDHYKWRAMRLCEVDEEYITGKASYHDKFVKYAEIVPQLAGNPLYYWTHLELKQVFGIVEPLNKESAGRIYKQANEKLKARVQNLRPRLSALSENEIYPQRGCGEYLSEEIPIRQRLPRGAVRVSFSRACEVV